MKRADEIITDLGLAESRTKARALIEEKKVFCDGRIVDKPSRKFGETSTFCIDSDALAVRYVSRAGLKLEAFLEKFRIDLRGAEILDAGASTGGFTDCALSRGAKSAVCADVGTGQLHPKLREDSRVRNLENTDVRSLSREFFGGELFDFICADLSFISLEKVILILKALLKPGGTLVCLVKPQFESSPEIMRKHKGVLKDSALQLEALEKIRAFATEHIPSVEVVGTMESPIRGGDGNVEFLIGMR